MYAKADTHGRGGSAEDNMKWAVVAPFARDKYDQNLYQEATRRVIFRNCFSKCELTHEEIPHFNKKFYFENPEAQHCLQDCHNTRMVLHMGEKNAKKYDMMLDFERMKQEYRGYMQILPANRRQQQYMRGGDEQQINTVLDHLRTKSAN
jgi:uncharacterized protein YktA (UPF0223 family)